MSARVLLSILFFAAPCLRAQGDPPAFDPVTGHGIYTDVYLSPEPLGEQWHLFEPGEFFVDGFYARRDFDGAEAGHGGGVGFGCFATRHFGGLFEVLGVGGGADEDMVLTVSAVARLPIDHAAFALYALIGGGYGFGAAERWNLEVGGGIDVRLLDRLSSFCDLRYVDPDGGSNGTSLRIGFRRLF